MTIPKSDKIAYNIYKHFYEKFRLGEIGVVEAVCVASMFLKKQKPFSLIIVAPSGQMKSSIMDDVVKIFPEKILMLSSRHTPFGLVKEYGDKLKNKTWVNNDMVRTFTGISRTKIEEIVGFYSELMSEKTSGSATAFGSALKDCKMNMIGNIAMISYNDVKDKFITATFSERVLFFVYVIDKNDIRFKTKKGMPIMDSLINIQLKETEFIISKKQKIRICELSDKLVEIAHYGQYSMRPDEIVESFICAYALLNGRDKIKDSDFKTFESLFPFFKRVI